MSFTKKIFHFISTIFFYSIILILGIFFLMFLFTFVDKKIALKNGISRSPLFGAYVIISNSMVPHINVYDAVVTVRVNENQIHVDDIITFISKEIKTAGTPITHRVIGIVYEDNKKENIIGYRTKGDHNNTADFALIAPDEVIGKVFLRIPMLGYLQTIMTKPIGWLFIIVIPCILIIASDILKLLKSSNQKEKVPNISDLNSSITSDDKDENEVSSIESVHENSENEEDII